MYKKEKGFTLLELTLVLVIITAIILIAGRYYAQANEASKVAQTVSKTRRIIEASFEWVKACKTFAGLPGDPDCPAISKDELINKNLLSSDDVQGSWSIDDFSVSGTTSTKNPQNYSRIKITIPDVPKTACLSLQDSLTQQNIDTSAFNCNQTNPANQTLIYPNDED